MAALEVQGTQTLKGVIIWTADCLATVTDAVFILLSCTHPTSLPADGKIAAMQLCKMLYRPCRPHKVPAKGRVST